jgi:hypothetical protein
MEPVYEYNDSELCGLIDRAIEDAQDFESEQAKALNYYQGRLPTASGVNSSDYISMEVFDVVESLKAKLIRTFASNRDVVRFKPMSEQDVEAAATRTKYVNRVFHGENSGLKLLHDMFHDGLVSRFAYILPYYRQKSVLVEEPFENQPEEVVQAAAMRDEVQAIEIQSESYQDQPINTPLGPAIQRQKLVSGVARVLQDQSKLCVEVIPPECVSIPDGATDLTDPDVLPSLVLTYTKRKYELIQEGFDPELVETLHAETLPNSAVRTARQDAGQSFGDHETDEREEVTVNVAYLWLDMEGSGHASKWRIIKSGSTLLDKGKVKRTPGRFWTPFPQSHKAVGLSAADLAYDIQNAQSKATQGIIDNVYRVNAGLRIANMQMIRNPRDLIDNPIGGIIDSQEPMTSVNVVPQPQVSGATMGLMQLLTAQKEMRTGDTGLSKGLNAGDVVTHQNSKEMIDRLIDVGNERPLAMARLFAELTFKPLLQDIYALGAEHEYAVPVEVEGRMQKVHPGMLPPGDEMTVDIALTPEYGDQQAQRLMMIDAALRQKADMAPLYSMEEQYAVMSEVFHVMGMANWLANPREPKVQQRMALAQQKAQQAQQQQMAAAEREEQRQERLVKAQELSVTTGAKLKKEALDLDAAQGAAEQRLDETKFQWQVRTDVAELNIEDKQRRPVAVGVKNA